MSIWNAIKLNTDMANKQYCLAEVSQSVYINITSKTSTQPFECFAKAIEDNSPEDCSNCCLENINTGKFSCMEVTGYRCEGFDDCGTHIGIKWQKIENKQEMEE